MRAFTRLFGEGGDVLDDADFRLLLLATILAPLGTGIVSPILDSLTGVFGVSPARIGLMVAAVTAPGIVVIPLVGGLSDRYGRKAVLVAGLVLFGGGGVAISLTTDFRAVLALRLVQGFGFSGIVPTLVTAIGDLYDGGEEATAQGIRLTTVGVSQVVFPFVAGSLVAVAWQYPFLLYAVALPIAAMLYLRFEEPADLDAGGGGRRIADGGYARDLVGLAATRRVAPVLFARGLPVFVWYGFLTYNSIVVIRLLGGTPQVAGLVVAASSAAFTAGASQSGRITSVAGGRFAPLVGAHAGLAAGFSLLAFAPSIPVAILGALVGGAGFGMAASMYRSVITGLAPEGLRGGVVSISESFGRVTATVAPIAMGAVIGAAAPAVGFEPALRWTMAGAGIAVGLAGVACLAAARPALSLE